MSAGTTTRVATRPAAPGRPGRASVGRGVSPRSGGAKTAPRSTGRRATGSRRRLDASVGAGRRRPRPRSSDPRTRAGRPSAAPRPARSAARAAGAWTALRGGGSGHGGRIVAGAGRAALDRWDWYARDDGREDGDRGWAWSWDSPSGWLLRGRVVCSGPQPARRPRPRSPATAAPTPAPTEAPSRPRRHVRRRPPGASPSASPLAAPLTGPAPSLRPARRVADPSASGAVGAVGPRRGSRLPRPA